MEVRSTCLIDKGVITAVKTIEQPPKVFVVHAGGKQELLLQKPIGDVSLPLPVLEQSKVEPECFLGNAGLQVLALEGGGRGPIINYGETVTAALLLTLLNQTLGRDQLHPDLIAELERIPTLARNTKEQSGYAAHNDVVTLDAESSIYLPVIRMSQAPGQQIYIKHNCVGEEPDCIDYMEIPDQDLFYGHGGVVNRQFTVKAAFMEKSVPVAVPLNWSPAAVSGPPLNVLTAESAATVSSVCMCLRVKGTITLMNNKAPAVAGAMFVQIQVDGGPWTNIAMQYRNFPADNPDTLTEAFDIMLAYDQQAHTYKFRGQLLTESSTDDTRELVGSFWIDTVTEYGSGAVLSNSPLIQWTSKEKL